MVERSDGVDSVFRYILIAARRAEQLIDGARPRLATRYSKPTLVALAELDAGVVPWRRVTPEEYEQLRQEELLRAQGEEQTMPILPLVPPPVEAEAVVGEESDEMDEAELEDELEGPDFDAAGLEDVEEPSADELLAEEDVE
ncbi:MAG: DNA-directed RNA polymerase subunit omega [Thermoanaerobaculaceae bacterium]|jgi:DNA-directed RNA polymerase subunit K/omega|nr:DNA-directed RNA polymerase subunit omega [Thermoanaerobaculaceae bacterium]